MPNLDIQVSADLQQAFQLPTCEELKLPKPEPISIQLPTGGSLKAFADISKGIPTDCSMTFSLLLQIAPLLASMDCIVKILKLLKPLIDIITGLTKVPPSPPVSAIQDFVKAAAALIPCFLIPTPAAIIPFVRDILCLILKVLNCFIGQMGSLLNVMQGITLQLQVAQASGNTELEQTLKCAQENAQISAQHLTGSIEPIGVILDLVGPLMGIAGAQPVQLPKLGGQTDLASLNQVVQTMQGVVGTIQGVVDALGGCPS